MWKLVSSSFSNDSGETRSPDRLDSAGSRDVRCRTCKQRAASRPRRKASSAHRPRECGARCARDGQHPPAQGECLLARPKRRARRAWPAVRIDAAKSRTCRSDPHLLSPPRPALSVRLRGLASRPAAHGCEHSVYEPPIRRVQRLTQGRRSTGLALAFTTLRTLTLRRPPLPALFGSRVSVTSKARRKP